MSRSPFTWGTRILAVGALLFALFLGVGALLPGTWDATGTRVMAVPPEEIFPYLDGPEGWQQWTPWPEAGLETEGPSRGPGAIMRWDHPEMGDGVFEILEVEPPRRVRYRVLVEEGALRTDGRVELEPTPEGTRVTWTEEGDFGWNPLMGYWALAMAGVQGEELQKGLERLEALLTGSASEEAERERGASEDGDTPSS